MTNLMRKNIPIGWNESPFDQICKFDEKKYNPTNNPEDFFNYITISDIEKYQIKKYQTIIGSEAPSRARKLVNTDDIIISTVRPYLRAFAKVTKEYDNFICSTGFSVLTPRKMLSNYVYYLIQSEQFVQELIRKMVGAAYPAIKSSDIKNIIIPVPPINEQNGIIKILNTVDQVIESTSKIINNIESLKQGTIQKILMHGIKHTEYKNTSIGKIPLSWNIVPIGEICKVRVGHVGPVSKYYTEDINEIPLFSTSNISTSGLDIHNIKYVKKEITKIYKNKEVNSGDLIVARHGDSGTSSIIPENIKTGFALNVVIIKKSDKILSKFLESILNSDYYRNKMLVDKAGAVQGVINTQVMKKFIIPLPSIDEQRSILNVINKIEKIKINENMYKEKMICIKKELLQQLLSGEIRIELKNNKINRI